LTGVGVAVLLLLTAWVGWRQLREAAPAGAGAGGAAGRGPSTVIVRPAEQREVVATLAATGTLRAVRRADVAARESAAVEAVLADEGDRVEEGAVMARLDPRRLEAQVQEAEAGLTALKAELAQRLAERERAVKDEEMMRGLWDQRAVAEREFLDSVREAKVAAALENVAIEGVAASEKRLRLLEVRRADLEVRAPFAGRVVARHAELGEWLREGDPVVTLVSTGEVEAWLHLPERHASTLKQATPESVELRVPGHPNPIRADRLALVPDVDGRSRRFTLVAHIPDPDDLLTPGTSVEANVPLGTPEERIVVSSDAVVKGYDASYVFVPDRPGDGPAVARRVEVEVLFERGGESVLAPGPLAAGDLVVVEGNERLFPNAPIDPQPWGAAHAAEAAPADGSTAAR
jgi:RND family efflux transporter MFP subunit